MQSPSFVHHGIVTVLLTSLLAGSLPVIADFTSRAGDAAMFASLEVGGDDFDLEFTGDCTLQLETGDYKEVGLVHEFSGEFDAHLFVESSPTCGFEYVVQDMSVGLAAIQTDWAYVEQWNDAEEPTSVTVSGFVDAIFERTQPNPVDIRDRSLPAIQGDIDYRLEFSIETAGTYLLRIGIDPAADSEFPANSGNAWIDLQLNFNNTGHHLAILSDDANPQREERAVELQPGDYVLWIRWFAGGGSFTVTEWRAKWDLSARFVRCDVVGTEGDDNPLAGTSNAEVICGLGGDDFIDGRGGEDIIFAGPGNDLVGSLLASSGITVYGGDGDDIIQGDIAEDALFGEAGDDEIKGGFSDDHISGGDGHDKLDGEDGDDWMQGGDGDDQMDGGVGADLMEGNNGFDKISGGDGNDEIHGGDQKDVIHGDDGDDIIIGAEGADVLYGDAGNDIIRGGKGNDEIFGGRGRDKLFGDNGNDVVHGELSVDRLEGGNGDDDLFGGPHRDILIGGHGEDYLNGGPGPDRLRGNQKMDLFDLQDGEADDCNGGGNHDEVLSWDAGLDNCVKVETTP